MTFKTADLCDEFGSMVEVADPVLRDYGGVTAFCGPIATVSVANDNTSVRDRLSEPGAGRVLVVDGGGSLHCALVGDMLAQLAYSNGWAGMVIYGCVRDVEELRTIPVGVKALNSLPRRSEKKGPGFVDVPVTFAGVTFEVGYYLYADADGILISPHRLQP